MILSRFSAKGKDLPKNIPLRSSPASQISLHKIKCCANKIPYLAVLLQSLFLCFMNFRACSCQASLYNKLPTSSRRPNSTICVCKELQCKQRARDLCLVVQVSFRLTFDIISRFCQGHSSAKKYPTSVFARLSNFTSQTKVLRKQNPISRRAFAVVNSLLHEF